MSWRVEYIGTAFDGQILSQQTVKNVYNKFKIRKEVGDEIFLKSGDLTLETDIDLQLDDTAKYHWLAVYRNGSLFDAFQIPSRIDYYIVSIPIEFGFEEWDEKKNRYKTKLASIQQKFFDDCNKRTLYYTTNLDLWGYGLVNSALEIAEIKITNDLGAPLSTLNRWGFSLGDMIYNLSGSENKGYKIRNITFPGPLMNQNNLPILYRGLSEDTTLTPVGTAIDNTFYAYGTTWLDILKFASFAFNAFIRCTPVIYKDTNDYLAIDIDIIPRINLSPSGTKRLHWKERKFLNGKYRIDGVNLSSSISNQAGDPSFSYQQGAWNGDHVFSKKIDISDPEETIETFDETLYWSVGDYNAGNSNYDILDGSNNTRPYFASGLVEDYYDGLISLGHGYKGKIFSDEEEVDLLDNIVIDEVDGSESIIQIVKIDIDKDEKISIEGVKIA